MAASQIIGSLFKPFTIGIQPSKSPPTTLSFRTQSIIKRTMTTTYSSSDAQWWLYHECGSIIPNNLGKSECTNEKCSHVCCEQCGPASLRVPNGDTRSQVSSLSSFHEDTSGGRLDLESKGGYANTWNEQHRVTKAAAWTQPKEVHDATPQISGSGGYTEPVNAFSAARSGGTSYWERPAGQLIERQQNVGYRALGEEESAGCKCVIL